MNTIFYSKRFNKITTKWSLAYCVLLRMATNAFPESKSLITIASLSQLIVKSSSKMYAYLISNKVPYLVIDIRCQCRSKTSHIAPKISCPLKTLRDAGSAFKTAKAITKFLRQWNNYEEMWLINH